MNKLFFLLFPFFLFAQTWSFPHKLILKKDETAFFDVYYRQKIYPLEVRWTLYINNILTVLYKYDGFPRQITLFKDYPLNTFRIDIAHIPERSPYFLIKFLNYNGKFVTFYIFIKNGDDVRVDFKGKK